MPKITLGAFFAVHQNHQCEGCNRTEFIEKERLLVPTIVLKVVLLLLFLLILIEATVLVLWGYFVPSAFTIGIIVWAALGIPIAIAAYLSYAMIVKYSNRIDEILVIVIKAVAAYVVLSFIIAVISTCVVLIWVGFNVNQNRLRKDPTGEREVRVETFFIASLVQIGYILVAAGFHNFRLTHQLLFETAVFFLATTLITLILAASTSGNGDRGTGRNLLIVFLSFEFSIALANHLMRILDLHPNCFSIGTSKKSKVKKYVKTSKGKYLNKMSKIFTVSNRQKGKGQESGDDKAEDS